MIARIHVNQHRIKSNAKHHQYEPVITVKSSHGNEYAHEVAIDGPSRVIYSPDRPLSCGAKLWIECKREDLTLYNYNSTDPLEKIITQAVMDCELR